MNYLLQRYLMNRMKDPALTIGSAMVTEPVAGLMALGTEALGGDSLAMLEAVRNHQLYTPQSEQGRKDTEATLNALATAFSPLEKFNRWLGDTAYEAMPDGAPDELKALAGTLGYMGTDLLGMALGGPQALKQARNLDNRLSHLRINPTPLPPTPFSKQAGGINRMSKAEAEAKGYWHPVGDNKKLPKPITQFSREVVDSPFRQPDKYVNIDDLQGKTLILHEADRSDAGKILLGVNNKKFNNPVLLEGGVKFPRDNPDGVWASRDSRATTLVNRARGLLDAGEDPVYASYQTTHHPSTFNTMAADTWLELIQLSKIPKKAKKAFDDELRATYPKWPGIDSPLARSVIDGHGELRKKMVQVAGKEEYQQAGFPHPSLVRYAITAPDQLDTPALMGGRSFSLADGTIVENPIFPHKSYNTIIGGTYLGDSYTDIPLSLMARDFLATRKPDRPVRAIQLANPAQKVDQQFIDSLHELERMRETEKYTGDTYSRMMGREIELGRNPKVNPFAIVEATKKYGGFTGDPRSGSIPEEGLAVGAFRNKSGNTTVLPPGVEITPEIVQEFMLKNKNYLRMPGYYLGTWADKNPNYVDPLFGGNPNIPRPTGNTYLDVSRIFPEGKMADAIEFGMKTDQLAGMNLGDLSKWPAFKDSGWKMSRYNSFPIRRLPDDKLNALLERLRASQ